MTDPEKLKRPQVQHGATSPDLAGYLHVDDPTLENTDGGSDQPESAVNSAPRHDGPTPAQLLLQQLTTRQNDDYRHIRFESGRENPGRKYEQRVSFDTINIRAAEDPSLDFLDDESKAEFLATRRRLSAESMDGRGRGSDRDYLSLRSPGTSPNGSPTRVLSPLRGKDVSVLFQRGHLPYPTTPILTRKCCTLTRIHKDFEDLYLGNLASKGLWPTLRGRVIMVYVSGRKHTWVAMDWILCNFVQHGDTVVIVSSIPHALGASGSRFTHYPPPHAYPPKTEKVRQRQRNRPE
ncbi:hypothetical protein OXX69_011560, partial [Metschnikowia pulcherrima]